MQMDRVVTSTLGIVVTGVDVDLAEAAIWYAKAAERGNEGARLALGLLYTSERDPAKAVVWFRKAAEKGNARAQHNLGLLTLRGRGCASQRAPG